MFSLFGQLNIPLSGCRDLKPGDILGTTSSPLLHVPLESLDVHDAPYDVSTVDRPHTAPTQSPTSDIPDGPFPNLIFRLNNRQRESFPHLWDTVPPHI